MEVRKRSYHKEKLRDIVMRLAVVTETGTSL